MHILTFILACYGMTMIAVYGKIFDGARAKIRSWNNEKLNQLIVCPLCIGFWSGLLFSLLLPVPFGVFAGGCIGAGSAYLLCSIIDDEGIAVKIKKG